MMCGAVLPTSWTHDAVAWFDVVQQSQTMRSPETSQCVSVKTKAQEQW